MDTSIKVAVRSRPLSNEELARGESSCIELNNDIKQVVAGPDSSFSYDYIFDYRKSQYQIYDDCIRPLVVSCLEGYNATVLAYGQTGSGKTYTLGSSYDGFHMGENMGMIPRFATDLFERINSNQSKIRYRITVQLLELYGEDIRDLIQCSKTTHGAMNMTASSNKIMVREGTNGDVIITGAYEETVCSAEDIVHVFTSSIKNRVVSSTDMNAESSRSHAIFTVNVEQHILSDINNDTDSTPSLARIPSNLSTSSTPHMNTLSITNTNEIRRSKFHFVDLAGSERMKRTKAKGIQMKEGIDINKGLLALGNVISALGDESKKGKVHVPYRDSKLTRILQNSLGGNSKTLFICCVSPASTDLNETVNSLKYANRARNIKNKLIIHRDPTVVAIDHLKDIIQTLAKELLLSLVEDIQVDKEEEEENDDDDNNTTTTITSPKETMLQPIGPVTVKDLHLLADRNISKDIMINGLKLNPITSPRVHKRVNHNSSGNKRLSLSLPSLLHESKKRTSISSNRSSIQAAIQRMSLSTPVTNTTIEYHKTDIKDTDMADMNTLLQKEVESLQQQLILLKQENEQLQSLNMSLSTTTHTTSSSVSNSYDNNAMMSLEELLVMNENEDEEEQADIEYITQLARDSISDMLIPEIQECSVDLTEYEEQPEEEEVDEEMDNTWSTTGVNTSFTDLSPMKKRSTCMNHMISKSSLNVYKKIIKKYQSNYQYLLERKNEIFDYYTKSRQQIASLRCNLSHKQKEYTMGIRREQLKYAVIKEECRELRGLVDTLTKQLQEKKECDLTQQTATSSITMNTVLDESSNIEVVKIEDIHMIDLSSENNNHNNDNIESAHDENSVPSNTNTTCVHMNSMEDHDINKSKITRKPLQKLTYHPPTKKSTEIRRESRTRQSTGNVLSDITDNMKNKYSLKKPSQTNVLNVYDDFHSDPTTTTTIRSSVGVPLRQAMIIPTTMDTFDYHISSITGAVGDGDIGEVRNSEHTTGSESIGTCTGLHTVHTVDRLSGISNPTTDPLIHTTTSSDIDMYNCTNLVFDEKELNALFSYIWGNEEMDISDKNTMSQSISLIKDQIKEITHKYTISLKDVQLKIQAYQTQIRTLTKENDEISRTLQQSAIEYLNSSEIAYHDKVKLENQVRVLQQELRTKTTDDINNDMNSLNIITTTNSDLSKGNSQTMETLLQHILVLSQEVETLQEQKDNLLTQYIEKDNEYDTYRQSAESTLQSMKQQLDTMNQYDININENMEGMKTAFEEDVTSMTSALEESEHKIQQLSTQIEGLNNQIQVYKDEKIQDTLELEEWKEKLTGLQQDYDTEKESYQSHITQLEELIASCDQTADEEKEALNDVINQLNEQIQVLNDTIATLSSSTTTTTPTTTNSATTTDIDNTTTTSNTVSTEVIDSLNKEIAKLIQEKQEQLDTFEEERVQLNEKIADLKRYTHDTRYSITSLSCSQSPTNAPMGTFMQSPTLQFSSPSAQHRVPYTPAAAGYMSTSVYGCMSASSAYMTPSTYVQPMPSTLSAVQQQDLEYEVERLQKRVMELSKQLNDTQTSAITEKSLLKDRILKLNTQMTMIQDDATKEKNQLVHELHILHQQQLQYQHTLSHSITNQHTTEEDDIPSPRNIELSEAIKHIEDMKKEIGYYKEYTQKLQDMIQEVKDEADEDLLNLQNYHDSQLKEKDDTCNTLEVQLTEIQNKHVEECNHYVDEIEELQGRILYLEKEVDSVKKEKSELLASIQESTTITTSPTITTIAAGNNSGDSSSSSSSKGNEVYTKLVQLKQWEKEKLVWEEKYTILTQKYSFLLQEKERLENTVNQLEVTVSSMSLSHITTTLDRSMTSSSCASSSISTSLALAALCADDHSNRYDSTSTTTSSSTTNNNNNNDSLDDDMMTTTMKNIFSLSLPPNTPAVSSSTCTSPDKYDGKRISRVLKQPVKDSTYILEKVKQMAEKLNSPLKSPREDPISTHQSNNTFNKTLFGAMSGNSNGSGNKYGTIVTKGNTVTTSTSKIGNKYINSLHKGGKRDTTLWFEDSLTESEMNNDSQLNTIHDGSSKYTYGNTGDQYTTQRGNEFLKTHQEIAEMWSRQYDALLQYKDKYGTCNVPPTYIHDDETIILGRKREGSVVSRLYLGRWVQTQKDLYLKHMNIQKKNLIKMNITATTSTSIITTSSSGMNHSCSYGRMLPERAQKFRGLIDQGLLNWELPPV